MQLKPNEIFSITRQLDNPIDSNLYYVRAYIRNARTDVLLATVNLTDKTEQRFRGDWEVPTDPTGQGFYITITTKVFTDNLYTTESEDYGRKEEQFLIQDRMNPNLGFGGGGGTRVDYERIKKMIVEELSKIKIPEPKVTNLTKYNTVREKIEIDLSPLTKLLKSIQAEVEVIRNKKDKDVNFAPITSDIRGLGQLLTKTIKTLPDPQSVEILRAIKEVNDFLGQSNAGIEDIKQNTKKVIIPVDYTKEKLKKRRNIFLGQQPSRI
jgi:hypothetical protein